MFSLSLSEALNSPSFFFAPLEPWEVFRLTVVRRDEPPCGLCERIRSSPASVELQSNIQKSPSSRRKLEIIVGKVEEIKHQRSNKRIEVKVSPLLTVSGNFETTSCEF